MIWSTARNERQLKEEIERDVSPELYRSLWLPVRVEQQKWNGIYQEVEKMLFPGYLFLDTEVPETVHEEIKRNKNYIGILKSGDCYAPLTRTDEEIIRRLSGAHDRVEHSFGVIEGGVLRILDGPLRGFEKYIIKIDRHKRKAYLSMRLFGEERKFQAGLAVVEKR